MKRFPLSAAGALIVATTLNLAMMLMAATGASAGDSLLSKTAASDQIATWIRDLDAKRFADRQRASAELLRVGPPAISALTEAALGNSREASTRATLILSTHFESQFELARDQAELSLEKIAACGKPASVIARRALHPPPGRAAMRSFAVSQGEPIEEAKEASVAEGSLTSPQASGD